MASAIATDVMPMGTLSDDADVASVAASLAAAPPPVLASAATLDLPRKRSERFGQHLLGMLS